MTPPPQPEALVFRIVGERDPFLTVRPGLYPRMGPVIAELLESLRAAGMQVELVDPTETKTEL